MAARCLRSCVHYSYAFLHATGMGHQWYLSDMSMVLDQHNLLADQAASSQVGRQAEACQKESTLLI